MHAQALTFTIDGLSTRAVGVEVDIRPGLPSFTIVGLAGTAVREARERVHAAILNCGFQLPGSRITANLAPGDLPKSGPGLDLAIAWAIDNYFSVGQPSTITGAQRTRSLLELRLR